MFGRDLWLICPLNFQNTRVYILTGSGFWCEVSPPSAWLLPALFTPESEVTIIGWQIQGLPFCYVQ